MFVYPFAYPVPLSTGLNPVEAPMPRKLRDPTQVISQYNALRGSICEDLYLLIESSM